MPETHGLAMVLVYRAPEKRSPAMTFIHVATAGSSSCASAAFAGPDNLASVRDLCRELSRT